MDQVTQVREKTDIVALISEYIALRQVGRNFKTNCPFHGEKTPSFVVSPQRQIWHCFGCQKGGDVFTFLMEYESIEFPEALKILAHKAGIELIQSQFETGISAKKEKVYKLNHLSAEFYHYLLLHHKVGVNALSYITQERGIKEQVINTFMVGFAPRIGNALVSYLLKKKNYKKEELLDAGLAYERNGRLMDFFSNRIMFPLYDHRDNIIGFSGRVFGASNTDQFAVSKYVNTRETLVYHKGSTFFGLNATRKEIKELNQAIIMEGEFDVMTSFQEGIGNVVAVKGTALTENQVNLIARFAQKITLCFDQDKAGIDAMKRSVPVLEKKGLTITVVSVPNGKDPDDAIKTDPIEFKKSVKNDSGIYDFLLAKALEGNSRNTAEGKRKISEELLPVFARIENEIVKEHYLRKLSSELDTTYESIHRQYEKLGQPKQEQSVAAPHIKKGREEILEEYLLSLIVQSSMPKKTLEDAVVIISDSLSRERAYQKILYHLLSFFSTAEVFDNRKFGDNLPTELISTYDKCFLFPLPKFPDDKSYKEEIVKVSTELKKMYLQEKIKQMNDLIKENEAKGNEEEAGRLHEEFSKLVSQMSSPE